MKKKLMPIFALLLALTMVLTACDSIPGRGSGDDEDDRRGSSTGDDHRDSSTGDDRRDQNDDDKDSKNDGKETGGSLFGGLFGVSGSSGSSGNSDGDYEGEDYDGYLGDEMETRWFKFTVEDARCYSSLNGYRPASGYKYLVLDMSITNTTYKSLEMWDGDFWLIWGREDGEDAYPITEMILDDQLPADYKISIAGTKTGTLVYEVPAGMEDFTLSFVEFIDDGTEEGKIGDYFWVYFSAGDIMNDPSPAAGNDPASDPSGDDTSGGTQITGYMGDTLSTAFIDFRVDDMAAYSSIGDYTPSAGNMYLVLQMTIANNQGYEMPMYDTYFWLVWGPGDGEDGFPISEIINENQLPESYTIPVNGSRQGLLIYEVPTTANTFILDFEEYYGEGIWGDDFWVYLFLEG